jgi:photosystem II stability/assembly factor-like uncharacterized protein
MRLFARGKTGAVSLLAFAACLFFVAANAKVEKLEHTTRQKIAQQVPSLIDLLAAYNRAGLQEEQLLQGPATLVKHPLGYRIAEQEHENFLELYERNYVRLRAYPDKTIDPLVRVRAYDQLLNMRSKLNLQHLGTEWLSKPSGLRARSPKKCAWVSLGPTNINGRVTGIAIDPNNGQRIFATSVGGIWRSEDEGRRWQRVSEDFLSTIFASVALNPGNSREVYAGAGDPNYHDPSSGNGVWFSSMGGDSGSWTKISGTVLDTLVIYRIRIDPVAPNSLYVATSGGVYLGTRTGSSFNFARIAGFDAWTTDIAVDFSVAPRRIYAGVCRASSKYSKGVWKYNGSSWEKRDSGIPTSSSKTFALALAADRPNTIYAKVENGRDGTLQGIYKTVTGAERPVDGSHAWVNLSSGMIMNDSLFDPGKGGYSWYNSILEVDPHDANRVYGGGMSIFRSINGGSTWDNVSGGADNDYQQFVHADHHAVAFDPNNSKVVYVGDDGGIFKSTDTSLPVWHWTDISHGMIMTEFYHTSGQRLTASMIAGGSQDNGTEISFGNRTWYQPLGCDGADVGIDATNGDTLYANCNGGLYEIANPVPATPGGGSQINWNLPVNTQASVPIVTDPSTARAALMGGQVTVGDTQKYILLRTTDGVSWLAASPPLESGQRITFIAIAASSGFRTYYIGILGESSSTIWVTHDSGVHWMTTAKGLPNLAPTGAAVDDLNANRAIAVFGGTGGVYLTTNGGRNWSSLQGSGATALASIWVKGAVIDPANRNAVFIATGIGVFKGTIKDGASPTASWLPFDEGLADGIDVNSIWVNRATHELMIGTMGHGAYERDAEQSAACPATMLVVRDNVYDRGNTPSPYRVADAEHPIPDIPHPGFYRPDDTPAGRVHWWNSPDIRIDVPSLDPPGNMIKNPDHVEVESCPIEVSPCPPGTVLDSSPTVGQPANVYVQVANRGVQPSENVRVIALYTDATTILPNLPNDFWTTTFPQGTTNCGPLSAGSWHLIDTTRPCRTIAVVNPDSPEVAEFNWTVSGSEVARSAILTIVESVNDSIPTSVRARNEVRPNKLTPNDRHIAVRNLHIVSAESPDSVIQILETIRIPNSSNQRIPFDLLISNPSASLGTTVNIMLPQEIRRNPNLRLEHMRSVSVEPTAEQNALAMRLGATTGFATELAETGGAIRNLVAEPGQTVEVGVLLQSGHAAEPGTSSRVTFVAAAGNEVLGGTTFILRIPAQRASERPKRGSTPH